MHLKINIDKVEEMIDNSNGKIFSVVFIKKDGSIRKMHCRTRVHKLRQGGELSFSPKSKGLRVVYCLTKKAYRMINLKTITNIKIKGKKYIV